MKSSTWAVRTQNGPLLSLTGYDDLLRSHGPYKRSDFGKLKGNSRVVIRFQGQERAVSGPYNPKGTFHLPGLYVLFHLLTYKLDNGHSMRLGMFGINLSKSLVTYGTVPLIFEFKSNHVYPRNLHLNFARKYAELRNFTRNCA